MENALLEALADAPVLIVCVLIGRWLSTRIDRVLDLHERLIEHCYDADDAAQLHRINPPD